MDSDLPPLTPDVVESVSQYCLAVSNMALAEVMASIDHETRKALMEAIRQRVWDLTEPDAAPGTRESIASSARGNVGTVELLIQRILVERKETN